MLKILKYLKLKILLRAQIFNFFKDFIAFQKN